MRYVEADDGRNLTASLDNLREVCNNIKVITRAEIQDKLLLIKGFKSNRCKVGDIMTSVGIYYIIQIEGPSAKIADLNLSYGIYAS